MEDKILTAISRGIDPDMLRYFRHRKPLLYTFLMEIPLPIIALPEVSRENYFDELITAALTTKPVRLIRRKRIQPWIEDPPLPDEQSFYDFVEQYNLPITVELLQNMSSSWLSHTLLYGGILLPFDLDTYRQYGLKAIESVLSLRERQRNEMDSTVLNELHEIGDDPIKFKQFMDQGYAEVKLTQIQLERQPEQHSQDALKYWNTVERPDVNENVREFMEQARDVLLTPTKEYPINPIKMEQWIQAHKPKERKFFRWLTQQVRYVRFDELYRNITRIIDEFLTLNMPYVVIVPDFLKSDLTLFCAKRKSNW